MAHRLYTPRAGSSDDAGTPISPALDGSWEDTDEFVRLFARTARWSATDGGDQATTTSAGTGSNPNDVVTLQVIAGPYAAQDIGGNFKAVLRARETANTQNCRAQICVRALALDGIKVLATLVAHDTSALSNEWPNGTPETRRFPLAYTGSGPAVSATLREPFYIVIETGARVHSTQTGFTFRTYHSSTTPATDPDASETEGDTTTAVGWFEFSQDLLLYVPRFRTARSYDMGSG